MSKGLLLLNLGTPNSAEPSDVRRYLAEFLMDGYVIDISKVARFLLVYGIILPFRPKKSAKAYQKIWTERGSPLAFHLEDLSQKVAGRLSSKGVRVVSAMRYGRPSVRSALEKFKADPGISEITVFPMYPQYSLAASESSIQKVRQEAARLGLHDKLRFVPPFYESVPFVNAYAKTIQDSLRDFRPDHLLFSYHGLPERHMHKANPQANPAGGHCFASDGCCNEIGVNNTHCYRAQSFATTHALARAIGMPPSDFGTRYGISFQSRLGRTPWIRPYTDLVIPELAARGVKRLAVVCPSFVADCLETLEEIGIRAREDFIRAGGEELKLIPSLNSSDEWASAVCELAGA
jgi:ferrochelatase